MMHGTLLEVKEADDGHPIYCCICNKRLLLSKEEEEEATIKNKSLQDLFDETFCCKRCKAYVGEFIALCKKVWQDARY